MSIRISAYELKTLSGSQKEGSQKEERTTVLTDIVTSFSDRLIALKTFPGSAMLNSSAEMPELAYTMALRSFLPNLFGDKFVFHSNEYLLGKENRSDLPVCRFATAKPDMAFFHKDLFVTKSTLLCGVVPMDIEENDHTLLGCVSEDKKGTRSKGVSQLIAGMVALSTNLGLTALARHKFFSKSIIFGACRQVESPSEVTPMQLIMNFETGQSMVYLGQNKVDMYQYFDSLRLVLNDPEKFHTKCQYYK